ncbi:NUDIX domain-containing protein [Robinsoniella peoriensis]
MSRTENVELTVLCLIEDGDRVLLQNRTKKDWQGYALPGGHVEQGESFVDAVIREMMLFFTLYELLICRIRQNKCISILPCHEG